ncbi:hypothetical protein LINPERHAP1_LOCUS5978 [Linum perenne]
MQNPQGERLEDGGTTREPKQRSKYWKSIAIKPVKRARLWMPQTINAEKPQPQGTEEQGAKSIDEDTESDDCEFLISHRAPPIQRGNHPQSSFRNSRSEYGGPSSSTRAKVTGCATTKTSNMDDEALKDTAEGAGKKKVNVDVTERTMKAKEKSAGKRKMTADEEEKAMKAKEKAAGKRKMTADEEEEDAGNLNHKAKPKLSLRSRCAPKKIRDIVHMSGLHASKLMELEGLGFTGTTQVRIGSLCLDFLKWAFECYDVNTKVFHFKKNDRLRITEGDVSEVYGLPRGNKSVAKKVAEFKNSYLTELGIDSGLEIENSPREMVLQSVIQRRLENEQDDEKWKKLMTLYIIVVLLCPKERLQASLKFLPLLEEDSVGEFTSYNWCKYVVDHFRNGFRTAKQNMEKKGTAAMFVGADINLLMYGSSPLDITPYCARWDTKMFKETVSSIRYEGGNTFLEGPVEEELKFPRPLQEFLETCQVDGVIWRHMSKRKS